MKKIKTYIVAHKVLSTIAAIVIIFIGYKVYAATHVAVAQTKYVLGTVEQGTIVSSLDESGQVSASRSLDLSPKSSGTVTYVGVKSGEQVKAGQLIVKLDTTDAEKSVTSAEQDLESAELSYQKFEEPATQVTMLQAQDSVSQDQQSITNDQDSLAKDYDSGYSEVANAFTTLPTITAGLQNSLYSYNNNLGGGSEWIIDYFTNQAEQYDTSPTTAQALEAAVNSQYQSALAAYNKNFQDYRASDRTEATSSIAALINETYATTQQLADATKSATDLIQYYEDRVTAHNIQPSSLATSDLSTLNNYTGQINNALSSLLSAATALTNDSQSIVTAQRNLASAQASLAALQAGPDPLDVQSQQLSLQEKQDAVAQAKENLADYYVYAPFDGTISKVNVQVGDTASGAVATLITNDQIATLSLNEVDAAKVQLGQSATLTFDAIPGLSIAGTVSEIDTQGTVSQGVVTYDVEISFATEDTRVKPGMTVNAAIITAAKENVLVVPNTAIKTLGGTSYVQEFNPLPDGIDASSTEALSTGFVSDVAPESVPVVTGLSNNTETEITSGLNEGDLIVTKTTTTAVATVKSTTPTAASALTGGATRGGNATFTRVGGL